MSDGWSIGVDRTNHGCFLLMEWERGTVVRFGFDAERNYYIWVSHGSWQSLENGKKYSITVKFDDESPWTGPAFAMRAPKGTPFLEMRLGNQQGNFLRQFAVSQGVTFWYSDRVIARLSLKGSYTAMMEMQACQKTIDGSRATSASTVQPSDPFAAADPFRP